MMGKCWEIGIGHVTSRHIIVWAKQCPYFGAYANAFTLCYHHRTNAKLVRWSMQNMYDLCTDITLTRLKLTHVKILIYSLRFN